MQTVRSCLYVIATMGAGPNDRPRAPCKIGISADGEKRLKSIQTGNPQRLCLFGEIPFGSAAMAEVAERMVHEGFQEQRLSGEWFDVCPGEALLEGFGQLRILLEAMGLSDQESKQFFYEHGLAEAVVAAMNFRKSRLGASA